MNVGTYSLHWDNVPADLVNAQRSACTAMGLPISQHRIDGIDHGEWIDWVMTRMDTVDVFLFLDIDCVPLSAARVRANFARAAENTLIGAEGAANHLDPHRSYAGAWYVYINRNAWRQLGRPSAKASPHGDVCQLWTDVWRSANGPLQLIPPTHCETPKWDLPGRKLAYGTATTYGEDCFHLFESRGGNIEPFLEYCNRIAGRL
ncbi:MAG TPA: hypothetical protein VGG49_07830 [Steroidobacteraceae bacterium]|jgi:hypothetical protein